jgi:hypothetical protein
MESARTAFRARALAIATLYVVSASSASAQEPSPESCQTRGRCIMFVTSTKHDGNLGGLVGADGICNARASAAGLVGEYQAWLCDGSIGPRSRSSHSSVPYLTTDGGLIAKNWADLTDGSLARPINRDESGVQVSPVLDALPWSYVRADGECDDAVYISPGSGPCPAFQRCKLNCAEPFRAGWTSASPLAQGGKGDVNLSNGFWTDGVTGLCSVPKERIYCIEQ